MAKSLVTNINLLWGKLLIEELFRLGVSDICIAPGSRSTPLVYAASKHKGITTHCHFDERGLCYFALGLAKANNSLVAIVTTSGGAVANLHPGIIEANACEIPLIVVSADRPDELINCGANQAINQQGIFGTSVSHQLNLPVATCEIPAQFLLTSVDNAIAAQQRKPGPIHINCMFREPFYTSDESTDFTDYLSPLLTWNKSTSPYTCYYNDKIQCTKDVIHKSNELIEAKKVIVIIGQQNDIKTSYAIASWAERNNYLLLCDCQSSIKSLPFAINYYDQLLHLDTFSALMLEAELIIQFGGRLISKRLLSFIKKSAANYWLVAQAHQRLDPGHQVNRRYSMPAQQWVTQQPTAANTHVEIEWTTSLKKLDNKLRDWLIFYDQQTTDLSEYNVIRSLPNLLPEESLLFLSNSMPIRLYDMFAETNRTQPSIDIFTNRGASGIDGILATATGVSQAKANKPLTLVIGDTSLLHDLNSFALAAKSTSPLVVIVLNNDGGAIFNMLPISDKKNIRSDFYQMPHGYTFKKVSRMFSISYCQPKTLDDFKDNYQLAISTKETSVIEIIVPSKQTTDIVNDINKQLNASAL